MSYAQVMKSMNCISAIGRMPISAAPDAAPTMATSLIGVSMTRPGPNFSIRPLLNRVKIVFRRNAAIDERLFESIERILAAPLVDDLLRNVRLVVVLRVTFQSERLHLEQRDSAACSRVIDSLFRCAIHGEDVV